jgi:DNA-binding NarL/FixJ family response regulator
MNLRSQERARENLLVVSAGDCGLGATVLRGAALVAARPPLIVHSSAEAMSQLGPTTALVAFPLNVGRVDGVRFERALRAANPSVVLVAYGPVVRASIIFRLLSCGVSMYLDEPFTADLVARELECLDRTSDALKTAIRASVGACDLKEMQRLVRFTMCAEALDRVSGSRRAAARLLGVDRRAVQKLVEQMGDTSGAWQAQ